eukprot:8713719-Lingulodinium_polyedra.AAC.1
MAMPLLADYAFIFIGEIGQLSVARVDRIIKLRDYADGVPAVGMAGDNWQMAGFGEGRPWASHLWRVSTYAHKL